MLYGYFYLYRDIHELLLFYYIKNRLELRELCSYQIYNLYLFLEQFHLDEAEIDELISLAENEVDHAVSLHEFSETINNELSSREKIKIIENLWSVAYADTYLHKYEEYYIRKIADLLHVSHSDYIKTKLKTEKQIK